MFNNFIVVMSQRSVVPILFVMSMHVSVFDFYFVSLNKDWTGFYVIL